MLALADLQTLINQYAKDNNTHLTGTTISVKGTPKQCVLNIGFSPAVSKTIANSVLNLFTRKIKLQNRDNKPALVRERDNKPALKGVEDPNASFVNEIRLVKSTEELRQEKLHEKFIQAQEKKQQHVIYADEKEKLIQCIGLVSTTDEIKHALNTALFQGINQLFDEVEQLKIKGKEYASKHNIQLVGLALNIAGTPERCTLNIKFTPPRSKQIANQVLDVMKAGIRPLTILPILFSGTDEKEVECIALASTAKEIEAMLNDTLFQTMLGFFVEFEDLERMIKGERGVMGEKGVKGLEEKSGLSDDGITMELTGDCSRCFLSIHFEPPVDEDMSKSIVNLFNTRIDLEHPINVLPMNGNEQLIRAIEISTTSAKLQPVLTETLFYQLKEFFGVQHQERLAVDKQKPSSSQSAEDEDITSEKGQSSSTSEKGQSSSDDDKLSEKSASPSDQMKVSARWSPMKDFFPITQSGANTPRSQTPPKGGLRKTLTPMTISPPLTWARRLAQAELRSPGSITPQNGANGVLPQNDVSMGSQQNDVIMRSQQNDVSMESQQNDVSMGSQQNDLQFS